MGVLFEELASAATHEGRLTLRRRREPSRDVDVYEVKLDDEYLMSSLFTVAEEELARLALAAVDGLGLGYTARTVLADERVRSLTVVEALAPVIEWHEQGLLPDAAGLTADSRVRFLHDVFFSLAAGERGFALWSDDPPDADFQEVLEQVLADAEAHVVSFPNFLTGGSSANTVYVARTPGQPGPTFPLHEL